jgi:hypothetical protein
MSVQQSPSAFAHAANRLVPAGMCPFCGDRIEGITTSGPHEHAASPCGCRLSDE